MRVPRALGRLLRSRRLAVALIAGITLYSVVATLLPQTSGDGAVKVREWQALHPWLAHITDALRLHAAFSSPLFLLCVALLTASTIACAWERTRASARMLVSQGRATQGELARLRARPGIAPEPDAAAPTDPLAAVEERLRSMHLRVRRGPTLLEASSGRIGVVGSPVFHWTLALLLVVIALGRVSRADGIIGVPVGFSRTDAVASYGRVSAGPLFPGHSGLQLRVTDLRPYTDAGGVDRGVSPLVELRSGRTLLRRERLYPNHPMRYRALLIHSNDYGLAAVMSVESSLGAPILASEPLVDFADGSPSGTRPVVFDLEGSDGTVMDSVELTIPADREKGKVARVMPKDPVAILKVRGGGIETSAVLPKGGTMRLPTGELLRLKDVVYYARLSVADDWSVYPMYVLFLLAAVSMSVSVLVPYRRVLVLMTREGSSPVLRCIARHSRSDPTFPKSIESVVREAAGLRPSAEEESA